MTAFVERKARKFADNNNNVDQINLFHYKSVKKIWRLATISGLPYFSAFYPWFSRKKKSSES